LVKIIEIYIEILGSVAHIAVLWGLSIWLAYCAIKRLYYEEEDIHGLYMVIAASLGLVFNIIVHEILHDIEFHNNAYRF